MTNNRWPRWQNYETKVFLHFILRSYIFPIPVQCAKGAAPESRLILSILKSTFLLFEKVDTTFRRYLKVLLLISCVAMALQNDEFNDVKTTWHQYNIYVGVARNCVTWLQDNICHLVCLTKTLCNTSFKLMLEETTCWKRCAIQICKILQTRRRLKTTAIIYWYKPHVHVTIVSLITQQTFQFELINSTYGQFSFQLFSIFKRY